MFIGIKLISLLIILLLNIQMIKNDKTYILNQLLFISFCLLIVSNLSELLAFLISPTNTTLDRAIYVIFILTLTTAITVIFFVSYGLSSGPERLNNIYKMVVFSIPLLISWVLALVVPFNLQTIDIDGVSYQITPQSGIIAISTVSISIFYFILSLFYLTKTYRHTAGITRTRLKYFITGLIIISIIVLSSVILVVVFRSNSDLEFYSQMIRPLGVIIGGAIIGLGFIKAK